MLGRPSRLYATVPTRLWPSLAGTGTNRGGARSRSIPISVATRQRDRRRLQLQMLTVPCLSSVHLTSQIISQSLLATCASAAAAAAVLLSTVRLHANTAILSRFSATDRPLSDALVLRLTPWKKTRLGDDRLFSVVGPPVWNMLPVSWRAVDNITHVSSVC